VAKPRKCKEPSALFALDRGSALRLRRHLAEMTIAGLFRLSPITSAGAAHTETLSSP